MLNIFVAENFLLIMNKKIRYMSDWSDIKSGGGNYFWGIIAVMAITESSLHDEFSTPSPFTEW